ncbi:unnamed protein product [Protopolystoma xenopodis]|uniref:Uncharacterized protein n=1 Tax=Protopolystoma xenopodis TaxID=117903 RepID=A0A3S5C7K7_9PLAT|nr:unnamed protein product [Protopolystoma xenopodis]
MVQPSEADTSVGCSSPFSCFTAFTGSFGFGCRLLYWPNAVPSPRLHFIMPTALPFPSSPPHPPQSTLMPEALELHFVRAKRPVAFEMRQLMSSFGVGGTQFVLLSHRLTALIQPPLVSLQLVPPTTPSPSRQVVTFAHFCPLSATPLLLRYGHSLTLSFISTSLPLTSFAALLSPSVREGSSGLLFKEFSHQTGWST